MESMQASVADPRFPRDGVPTYDMPNFPKNCMKLKEFGGGRFMRPQFYYVDPPLGIFVWFIYCVNRE